MRQFHTKNTVECQQFCKPCGKRTQWRVVNGRPSACLSCVEKLEAQHNAPKTEPLAKQEGFDFK